MPHSSHRVDRALLLWALPKQVRFHPLCETPPEPPIEAGQAHVDAKGTGTINRGGPGALLEVILPTLQICCYCEVMCNLECL